MNDKQFNSLVSLPNWTWHSYDTAWMEVFSKLARGEDINKDWASYQRRYYKQGILSQDKIKTLESLPKWSWNPNKEHVDIRYSDLNDFIKEFGRMPKKQEEYRGQHIGSWVNKQKFKFKHGNLNKNEIETLNNIDLWSWNQPLDYWYDIFNELKKYINDNRKFPSTKTHLSNWITRQRANYNKLSLNKDQIKNLESLPKWKWARKKVPKNQ